jgi:hypothetical protein
MLLESGAGSHSDRQEAHQTEIIAPFRLGEVAKQLLANSVVQGHGGLFQFFSIASNPGRSSHVNPATATGACQDRTRRPTRSVGHWI